jgi:arginine decarboxylase
MHSSAADATSLHQGLPAAARAAAHTGGADAPSASNGELIVQRGMTIRLAAGTGSGPTELAAFDAALMDAGVANYNLLYLSSVIPPNSRIVCNRHVTPPHEYGQRLYVVIAQMRESRIGHEAHAGIGWVQAGDTGPGLFVELHDSDRGRLDADLHATLEDMRHRRAAGYGPVRTVIASQRCTGAPVCALVVAVYACEPWQ